MEETEALEALSDVLERLTGNPYDPSLHLEHIRVAKATGMQDQLESAVDMMAAYWAVGDQVWLPLIQQKLSSATESAENLESVLNLFRRAEEDYISIPLLQMHLEFLVSTYAHFYGSESDASLPEGMGDMFTVEWMRSAMSEIVDKAKGHLTKSHLLWNIRRNWELELLENAEGDKSSIVDDIENMHLERLREPHSDHAETFQSYSTFTTNNKPPELYEELLVKASKMRSQAVKAYERRERYEASLEQANFSLEGYAYYIAAERRMKQPDLLILGALYERAITEADKRRSAGEPNAEAALRSFWTGYLDLLRTQDVDEERELATFKRALRSVPASGEVWARYLRFLERASDEELELEDVPAAYARSQTIAPLLADVEQLVPVVLARAAYERRRLQTGTVDGEEGFDNLLQVIMGGIANVRKASTSGDPRLRLEKYLSAVSRTVGSPEHAVLVWEEAVKQYKTSYLAWTAYTEVLIEQHLYDDARKVFRDVSMKNIDWPEAIWEAWINFEQLHGSVAQLDDALDRVERANVQVNARRAKEAQRADYQASQIIAEAQATAASASAAQASAPVQSEGEAPTPMDVDESKLAENGTKRKAEDEGEPESSKKPRIEPKPVQLKRDRENSTVFVASLPADVQEEDLHALFKDCGPIREIKITQLPNSFVATVEFIDRDSVPAALTKDKKRVHGEEVEVHLAWKSTLYVTNFPEKADDTFIRNLFGKYGTIFDVRWPSKKFKSTRRFCYVQFTSPSSAQAALELHNHELEPDMPMSVLISDPERKKDRTDSDANDREVYVAGLSKFVTKEDLEKLFKTYGEVKEVRITLDKDGRSKGFAFVEFEHEKDAIAALAANNFELKKRRMAVTLADTRVRSKNNREPGHRAEIRNRSVRIRNLPANTQEALLQQALEKYAVVKRVEVFAERNEAQVELENPAEAGKLLLQAEPIVFNGNTLEVLAENTTGPANPRASGAPLAGGLFVPRHAVSRPRAGLGSKKRAQPVLAAAAQVPSSSSSSQPSQPAQAEKKGQDDFRKMLNGGK